jgi:nitroreductase
MQAQTFSGIHDITGESQTRHGGIASEPTAAADLDGFGFARALIETRQNVSPKRLVEPGPSPQQFEALMSLAAAVPDHGLLMPWRFIVVPASQRHALAEVFALALIDRDAGATLEQIESAREKAYRAPLLMVAVACLGPREPDIPRLERMISMGAAVQNLLLGAHAMGFGAGLTSGQAMKSKRMHALCGLGHEEFAVCCVNIGTASKRKSAARLRPVPAEFVSELGAALPSRCS